LDYLARLTDWAKVGWRLLRHKFMSGRIILLGVSQRYNKSVRGMAIAIALIEQLLKSHEAHKARFIEAGWVLEDNAALNALLRQFNFSPSKKFRLYIKALV
jgi:hypothetical protein